MNFTPTDTTTYKTATGTVSLQVNKVDADVELVGSRCDHLRDSIGSGTTGCDGIGAGGVYLHSGCRGCAAGRQSYVECHLRSDRYHGLQHATTSVTTTIEVGKATPTVTAWPTVSGLAYGAALSSLKLNGGVASANGAAVSGTFTWSTPSTIPGIGTQSYPVTFTPTDTTDYNTVAGTVSVSTDQVPTKTGLQSSTGEVMLQSPVTFTAAVTTSSGNPTGTVSFVDGSAPLGSAPLVNGVASLTISTLTAGSHTVSAMYSGDGTYAVSNGGTVQRNCDRPEHHPDRQWWGTEW